MQTVNCAHIGSETPPFVLEVGDDGPIVGMCQQCLSEVRAAVLAVPSQPTESRKSWRGATYENLDLAVDDYRAKQAEKAGQT